MNNTKVFGIKDMDFFNFIKKINEFSSKNKVFATQTYIESGEHFAVIYFDSQESLNSNAKVGSFIAPKSTPDKNQGKITKESQHPFNSEEVSMPKSSFSSPDYVPPTQIQIDFLKSHGIKDIPKSKKVAWTMINNIKRGVGDY